jgi:hypothetical protein
MKAKLLLHSKNIKGDEMVEIKIWQVPKSEDKPHGVKFSIVYVKGGKRVPGYDNGEGKGYHKHYLAEEEPYPFADIWRLLDDFKKELRGIRGKDWDEN